jgi:hypothetical protein
VPVRGGGGEEARAKETVSAVGRGGGNPEAPRAAVGWGTDGAGDVTVASLSVNVTVASVVGVAGNVGPRCQSGALHVTRPSVSYRWAPTTGAWGTARRCRVGPASHGRTGSRGSYAAAWSWADGVRAATPRRTRTRAPCVPLNAMAHADKMCMASYSTGASEVLAFGSLYGGNTCPR